MRFIGKSKKEIYTPQEVMEELYASKTMVYELLQKGKIEHYRLGRRYRIPRHALDDFMKNIKSP